MNQSAIIGGALLAGFALFVTSRNRLSTYGAIMWGAKPAGHGETLSSNTPISDRPKLPGGGTDYVWGDLLDPAKVLSQVYDDMTDQFEQSFGIGQ